VDDLELRLRYRRLPWAWARAHSRRREDEERRDLEENFGTYFRSAHFERPDDPESEGGLGVREPCRPKPSGSSDATTLPEPDADEDV
jgi:hypothetical protein